MKPRRLTHSNGISWFAAAAFAVSGVMWSQSIIAEVYSLNVLLFFVLVAQILGYCEDPSRRRFMGIGLVYGARDVYVGQVVGPPGGGEPTPVGIAQH